MKKAMVFLWLCVNFLWSFGQKGAISGHSGVPGLTFETIAISAEKKSALNPAKDDLSNYMLRPKKQKTLFIASFSHLDSQWKWDYQKTISKYLPKTAYQTFAMMQKYPDFQFNFTGSVRYKMLKEYHPALYEQLKDFIRSGQWQVSGSTVDESDVLIPSPESILRQVLYSNQFFREEYGVDSTDLLLPDCFGFPASLPSVINHAGLKGFSTQKLSWNSAVGIPFNLGRWTGVDDSSVVAALNPGKYNLSYDRLDIRSAKWQKRLNENLSRFNVGKDLRYVGVGDKGGALRERHVKKITQAIKKTENGIVVKAGNSGDIFNSMDDAEKKGLPEYKGEMLLTEHSAGILTSKAHIKQLNRENETFAFMAEAAATLNMVAGNGHYPEERIRALWEKVLMNQMHDIITGTSVPKAYDNSFNDEMIALFGFRFLLDRSLGNLAGNISFPEGDQHFLAFNPAPVSREEVFEVDLPEFPGGQVKIIGSDNREVEHQLLARHGKAYYLVYDILPPLSVKGYTVTYLKTGIQKQPDMANVHELENENLKISIDENGNVNSILDKQENREILSSPVRLVTQKEFPSRFPAWNMDWKDRKLPPKPVEGKVKIMPGSNGPLRTSVLVFRDAGASSYQQQYILDKGSKYLMVANNFFWKEKGQSLKQSFPLNLENRLADYHTGLGVIQRPNNHPKQFEVPSQQWFGLYDESKNYGVSILEDGKYGSDKPSSGELRLTLLYSPKVRWFSAFKHQAKQDWGSHNFKFAVYPHRGNWETAKTQSAATLFNLPVYTKTVDIPNRQKGANPFARLLEQSSDGFLVRAVKKAETEDAVVVRIHETQGRDHKGQWIEFYFDISRAELTNGQEQSLGNLRTEGNKVFFDISNFSIRTIRVFPEAMAGKANYVMKDLSKLLDEKITSRNGEKFSPDDHLQWRFPAEQLPEVLSYFGIPFHIKDGKAARAKGQKLEFYQTSKKLFLLAFAEKNTNGELLINEKDTVRIGFVKGDGKVGHMISGTPVSVSSNKGEIAWHCSHKHLPKGKDAVYDHCYLYIHEVNSSEAIRTLRLPDNPSVRILAITAVRPDDSGQAAAQVLQ